MGVCFLPGRTPLLQLEPENRQTLLQALKIKYRRPETCRRRQSRLKPRSHALKGKKVKETYFHIRLGQNPINSHLLMLAARSENLN